MIKNEDKKFYTLYLNKSKKITYKKPIETNEKIIRGVYDIETNNDVGKFIVGGLALYNGNQSEEIQDNYNISFHNKPYLVLEEIYRHNQELGGKSHRYEIAVHNLIFDIQSMLYNINEKGIIKYKDPGAYGRQDRNTYSIIMNDRKQIFSCSINYSGVTIIFWDTYKLYPASLDKICETYRIKNAKIVAGEETYIHKSFEDFCNNSHSVDYLCHDLWSVAELIDMNLYKKKTASSNAWDNMRKSICDNLKLNKKSDNAIATVIEFWGDNRLNDYLLPGYNGGFCWCNPKWSGVELENVIHLDINSSYPNSMYHLDLPLTHFTSKKIECDRYIIYVRGEFILKEGSFPIIKHPTYMNIYLDKFKGDILFTDIEWERIQKNYEIKKLKIIEVMNFPKTAKILRDFVEKNYAMKQNATGFLRQIAKNNLNQAYGKLAEHHDGQYFESYINDKCELAFKISDTSINNVNTEKSRCVIWSVYITAYSREKLYRCMDVLGDDFIYTDTDSIFTTLDETELRKRFLEIGEEIHDSNLGAWKIEGFSPYFKAIRAKCYLKTDDEYDKSTGKLNGEYRLNYVVAGYNGSDLVYGNQNKLLSEIDEFTLQTIFDDFKVGRVVHDKETSVTGQYGIKILKVKEDYEIKDKINNFEFVMKVGVK